MKHALTLISSATLFAVSMWGQTVPSGARIDVRTIEPITAQNADGRVFTATVAQDVVDTNGRVLIPRGAPAELMVRRAGKNDLVVDLDSVTINGRRYGLAANEIDRGGKAGLGANSRTGKFVGGGAVLGTVLGAIAGGGKGAAIGALAGGAAGAGTQILTRGHAIKIPSESVLTFKLEQPLTVDVRDTGYTRNGRHYHRN
jgi:hypothetical protein